MQLFLPVHANEITELKNQLKLMQQQLELLQSKIEAQELSIKKQQQTTHSLVENSPSPSNQKNVIHEIGDSIAIGGVIEGLASSSNSDAWSGNNSSDIVLDTLEIGISASAGDWVTGNVLFLYENASDDNLNIDEAYIAIANPDKTPVFAQIGRLYTPFGNFESHMISDPTTLTLAETREDVIQVGINMDNGFYSSTYLFNGDAEKTGKNNQIDNFGANLGYAIETDSMSLDVGLGYINNIATSDSLQDLVANNPNGSINDYIGGLSVHAVAVFGQINLIGEYISAMDYFEANELSSINNNKLKPRAWNLEAAYNFSMLEKDVTIAIAYQKTRDMYFDNETTDYFEKAWLASISLAMYENINLSAEWRHANAYQEVQQTLANNSEDEDLLQIKLSYQF
jgi:hypothetical protein